MEFDFDVKISLTWTETTKFSNLCCRRSFIRSMLVLSVVFTNNLNCYHKIQVLIKFHLIILNSTKGQTGCQLCLTKHCFGDLKKSFTGLKKCRQVVRVNGPAWMEPNWRTTLAATETTNIGRSKNQNLAHHCLWKSLGSQKHTWII